MENKQLKSQKMKWQTKILFQGDPRSRCAMSNHSPPELESPFYKLFGLYMFTTTKLKLSKRLFGMTRYHSILSQNNRLSDSRVS